MEELSSPEATEYYRQKRSGGHPITEEADQAPFDWEQFDPEKPEHSAHAENALDEMFDIASYLCADERRTAEDLVTEAVCQAVLPLKALQGIPKVQQYVAEALASRAETTRQPDPPPSGGRPAIII